MATPNLSDIPEIWKPIPGYEGFYSASSYGRIRRERTVTCARAGHILKPAMRGLYPFVQLCREGVIRKWSVHRAVAAAFLGPCPDGMEVNHINGDRMDASSANLEYLSSSQNQLHSYRKGLQDASGERNGQAKLSAADVSAIRAAFTGRRGQQAAIAREYGVSDATIRDLLSGRTWK